MAVRSVNSTLRRRAHARFATANKVEKEYLKALRGLVRNIDGLIKGFAHREGRDFSALGTLLENYSEVITPWAESVVDKMMNRIIERDANEWAKLGRDTGIELRRELETAPTGDIFRSYMREQVELIKSIPRQAGQRVHEITLEGVQTGRRAEDMVGDIMALGSKTQSRVMCIARTEVARTASALTMARAKHIGATHYYWRTSGDADVRESHKKMANKIIAWDDPPEVEPGKFYHAGMFPNCRCYPEPILDPEQLNV